MLYSHSRKLTVEQLIHLGKRCDTSALLLLARTSPEGTHEPIIFYDKISKRYIEEGLNIPIDHIGVEFEAFAMSGMKGLAKKMSQAGRNARRIAAKAAARHKITSRLCE